MDDSRFDALTRKLASGHSRRALVRGLIGGGSALVAARVGISQAAPGEKVTICHKPGTTDEATIVVASSSVNNHLGHGDYLGPCVEPEPECTGTGSACTEDGTGIRICVNGIWTTHTSCAPLGLVCRTILGIPTCAVGIP